MSSKRSGDAALIATAIAGAAMCMECIANKTDVPLAEVGRVLATIGSTVRVTSAAALCNACLLTKKVWRIL